MILIRKKAITAVMRLYECDCACFRFYRITANCAIVRLGMEQDIGRIYKII